MVIMLRFHFVYWIGFILHILNNDLGVWLLIFQVARASYPICTVNPFNGCLLVSVFLCCYLLYVATRKQNMAILWLLGKIRVKSES